MPRAPRLTGREYHIFFDISWWPTAAREYPLKTPVLFVCSYLFPFLFFCFRFLYFSPFVLFLFGSYAHSPNSALPRLLAPTAYHRGGCVPFGRFGILCTSRDLSLLYFRSSSRCRTACNLFSRVVVVVEALRVTPTSHMTHGVSGLGRSDSDKGPPFLWPCFIHSACQPPKGRLRNNMTTRCCLSFSQK